MQVGIIGLPLSGKTTLFNALTRGSASVDSYVGAKRESHLGVVKVPDPRLDVLGEIFQPKKITPTTVQYTDVAGLERGVSEKGGFSDEFLGNLRTVDALLLVLRLFEDENIIHPEGSLDPRRDMEIVSTEFLLSDMSIVDHRLTKLQKTAPKTNAPEEEFELGLMKRFMEKLENEEPLRELTPTSEEEKLIRGYQFLTIKPLLVVLNIGEDQIDRQEEIRNQYADLAAGPKCAFTAVSAEVEMEIEQLEEDEAEAFFEEMGIKEPALSLVVRESYDLLGLITFFTYVSDEVRAWTIPRGATAKQAAGAVHTDMERGFIRAEVVSFDNLRNSGSLAHCREQGLLRLEGKDYIVQDGDVITFRFNV